MNSLSKNEKGGRNAPLFFEHQQFTGNIIKDHHKHAGHQFHHISVPAQHIHRNKNNCRFQYAGDYAASNKFRQLRHNGLRRPVMAFEHKGFVGQVSKSNRKGPRNHIADRCAEMKQIIAGQINEVIDRSSQHPKEQIGNDIIVFYEQIVQFFHGWSSKWNMLYYTTPTVNQQANFNMLELDKESLMGYDEFVIIYS